MPSASAFLLIHWAFDTSAQLNGYGFPFDRSHLVFYHRLKTVYALVEAIWQSPFKYEKIHRPFHKLFRLIKQVMDDQGLKDPLLNSKRKQTSSMLYEKPSALHFRKEETVSMMMVMTRT